MTNTPVAIQHGRRPAVLRLEPACCDVWHVDLDNCPPGWSTPSVLSVTERQRANRFREDIHRMRFVAARSALRRILGRYLQAPPESLAIDTCAGGRPILALHSPWSGALDFNLSHSEGVAAIAVALDGPVGIDTEVLRPIPEAAALGDRYFSPRERGELQRRPLEIERTFLVGWTRKEAVLKSVGTGLALDPATIDVGAHAGERTVSVSAGSGAVELKVISFQLDPACIAACAVPANYRLVRVFPPVFLSEL